MNVSAAIDEARRRVGDSPVHEGEDPRWQAFVRVGEYVASEPERIWAFIEELHETSDADLQAAIATCLLEHLLEEHPSYRTQAERLASASPQFRRMLGMCW